MRNVLIFLPENEVEKWSGLLCGKVFHATNGIAIYVLGNRRLPDCKLFREFENVGEIGDKKTVPSSENWLFIKTSRHHVESIDVSFEPPISVSVVLYNRDHIRRSQWLHRMRFQDDDFIFRLINEVRTEAVSCFGDEAPFERSNAAVLAEYTLLGLQKMLNLSKTRWFAPVFRMTTFGSHLFNILELFTPIMERIASERGLRVHEINFIAARILDMLLGQVIILYVMSHLTSAEIFSILSHFQEFVVAYLKNTVEWLMGSPAGFKLNCPLNNVMGPFYQFHISLWWTFLRLSKPLLWVIFHFLLFLGHFGLSLQVAILTDLLAIVSVHIYCIYVYAARLYFFQMKGLKILSRLFIGKKRNPLPGTEYSSPYTTEQLLFGTVSFTILLFLLPTTLIYYCVFTAIRIVLILLGGIFTRVRRLMMAFPIYICWLWFYDPMRLTCTVRLSHKSRYLPDGTLVTKIKPVCESWMRTVQMNTSHYVIHSDAIEWRKLTTDVLVGNLIYPV